MGCFMTAYVIYFIRKYKKVGHLFQGAFQVRRINGAVDLNNTFKYIRSNPLEAGLVGEGDTDSYRWLYIKKFNP